MVGRPARGFLRRPGGPGLDRGGLGGALESLHWAAASEPWPLPKALVPFFSCSIGTFPEPNYSAPPLQEVMEYPNGGLSVSR